MQDTPSNAPQRRYFSLQKLEWKNLLLWCVAYFPAVYLLWVLSLHQYSIPFEDSWAYIKQYKDWTEGSVGAFTLLIPHNAHPSAVGKLVYFFVLHFLQGQVGLLPFFSWFISLAISFGVYRLAKPLWVGRGVGIGPLLMLLVNLAIFSGGHGHAWTWDFVFQNYFAGCFLVWGMVCLWSNQSSLLRVAVAFGLSTLATFSFATGLFVGILLLPMAWLHLHNFRLRTRLIAIGLWIVLLAGVITIALHPPGWTPPAPPPEVMELQSGKPSRFADFLSRPMSYAQYAFVLLGMGFGQGSPIEPVLLCGILGLITFGIAVACCWLLWRQRGQSYWKDALPWLICCGYGGLSALMITWGRFNRTLDTALAPRYLTFTLFFIVGVVFLCFHALKYRSQLNRLACGAALVGGVFLFITSAFGFNYIGLMHMKMEQQKYTLCLADILPLQPPMIWKNNTKYPTVELAKFLHSSGRLRGVEFLKSASLDGLKRKHGLNPRFATFDLISHLADNQLEARGTCGVDKEVVETPPLILITAQTDAGPEKIIAATNPELPEDFLERATLRRRHLEHYLGWAVSLDRALIPATGVTVLRAYGFDGENRKASEIGAAITLPNLKLSTQ